MNKRNRKLIDKYLNLTNLITHSNINIVMKLKLLEVSVLK
jgi:hypothetical protein